MFHSKHSALALAILASMVCSPPAAPAADLFPFVLPWDDSTHTATDVSAWLDLPAGKEGFVAVTDGHLYEGGKRLRIFGVNFAFGANFPTKADAPKVAARMAKFGINCVRFHHMDNQSAPNGIWAAGMRSLDAGQLDKLDFFISKLKEHGIYADLNLHVSRTYPDRPGAEKAGNPSYDKGVDNFSAQMIEEQKEYARELLSHVNPYTGNAYVNEPGVALIEINNENALLFEWWSGGLDKIAAAYKSELSQLWTAWLASKYGSGEKQAAAWAPGAHAAGSELLANGDFSHGLDGWSFERHEGAEATATVETDGTAHLRVGVTKPASEPWHVQIGCAGLKLKAGESYTMRFKAKSDANRSARVGASQAHEPWGVIDSMELKLTPEWKAFTFSFVAKQDEENTRVSFTSMGTQVGAYDFAAAHLSVSAVNGDVARDSAGLAPVFTRAEYALRTVGAQTDWHRFLWSLEERYWPGMYRFLRDELHAKPLIVGTQLYWSPFPIQQQMDVIDSHAYWQHPEFLHGDWNDKDWTVHNIPMAGSPNGGTLPGLALQRVAGKPYICSEYNESAPNTYSAETFPLICAFAAAQDWDGIFAFAYSHRTDDWNKGYFPSFFDIDQHPVKMATLPAALATWLRGDVPPFPAIVKVITPQAAIEQARKGGPRIAADQFGVARQEAFTHRISVSTALEAQPGASGPPPTSLVWDTKNARAIVDTARSKALIGKVGEPVQLGGVKIAPGESMQHWSVIQITVLEGPDFKSAHRVLVTATGYAENSGMKWHDEAKSTVGRDWGHAPSLVEGIGGTITLPPGRNWKAWALDETGVRKTEVPVADGALRIGPQWKTLWYEMEAD